MEKLDVVLVEKLNTSGSVRVWMLHFFSHPPSLANTDFPEFGYTLHASTKSERSRETLCLIDADFTNMAQE